MTTAVGNAVVTRSTSVSTSIGAATIVVSPAGVTRAPSTESPLVSAPGGRSTETAA